jgi:hypothetical protein
MVPPVTPVAREFPAMMANQYGSAIRIMFTCVLPPIITAGAFCIIQRQHQSLSMNLLCGGHVTKLISGKDSHLRTTHGLLFVLGWLSPTLNFEPTTKSNASMVW